MEPRGRRCEGYGSRLVDTSNAMLFRPSRVQPKRRSWVSIAGDFSGP